MNTIIWKGVPSTRIDGLLICELPPISKPPLRVKETMIDGRDGSIIEDLGYEPYTKSITIGLRGNFLINQVIKYFTGEGEIIFSNEPDKVYTAKVISQIDYNRLLRFRTAVVQFRVQPYKHKYNEAYKEAQTATARGTSIVVTDAGNATVKNISIGDGSKTSGEVAVTATGKNLLPYPYYLSHKAENGMEFTVNNDGTVNVKGTSSGFAGIILAKTLDLVDGVHYLLSGETSKISLILCYKDASGETIYARSVVWSSAYTFVQVYIQVNGGVTLDEIVYPMLEIGSTASAFEPYKKSEAVYDYATKAMSNHLKTFEPNTIITNADGATMTIEYFKPFEVFNEGLENSKPIMVLRGSGMVSISVNGVLTFTYTFPDGENEVVIDSEKEDAYLGNVLKNRNMNGDFPVLLAGTNKIEWSGYVESIEILPRSRWL